MKILIIDDSPTEAHVVKGYLMKHNMEVLLAHDAESGIQIAKQEMPDAILMDVVMPGMNGFHHIDHQGRRDGPGVGHAPGGHGLSGQAHRGEGSDRAFEFTGEKVSDLCRRCQP
jgi:CheY-like chemotaxis protein